MSEIQVAESLTRAAAATSSADKHILFGKYEVGRLLGCGGFAKVYHARNVGTGQSVAIKAISKARVEKNDLAAHVTREVTIMRRLRHPHIIRLIEVLASKTKVYFALEFAKGGELFAKVAKGRFSEDLGRRYFQQLISAVGYCHSRGVFHRDLKPENMLLDENWNLKVTDFGLSTLKEDSSPNAMLGTLCGTPAYVAPEVLGKKGYFGDKVDVWSCGIILFVLTAGYLPFNDTNLMNLYRKIYKGEFRCPRWMSAELKGLLHRLLDVNPDTRITIQEIINDPWFKKDYKEVNFRFYNDDYYHVKKEEEEWSQGGGGGGGEGESSSSSSRSFMNAFDLISFSPGFNLSGLFLGEKGESNCCETFVSVEAAETVVERLERAAREAEGGRVAVERVKGGMGVRLEGQNGEYGLVVVVHRLTEELVVVEVRNRGKDVGPSLAFWKNKLRPKISNLIYEPSRVGLLESSGVGPAPGPGEPNSTAGLLPGPSNRTRGVYGGL